MKRPPVSRPIGSAGHVCGPYEGKQHLLSPEGVVVGGKERAAAGVCGKAVKDRIGDGVAVVCGGASAQL